MRILPVNLEGVRNLLRQQKTSKKPVLSPEEAQLLEEIAYLCLNQDFLNNIKKTRRELQLKIGCDKLPVKTKKDEEKERQISLWLLKTYLVCKEWYRNELKRICNEHGLPENIFAYNYFNDVDVFIKSRLDNLDIDSFAKLKKSKDFAKYVQSKKKGADFLKKSFKRLLDEFKKYGVKDERELINSYVKKSFFDNDRCNSSILDNIIFSNDPVIFPSAFEYATEFSRWGYLYFDEREGHLKGRFGLYSSKQDIKKAIDNTFKEATQKRKLFLEIKNKRDHRKDALDKSILAYSLYKKGLSLPRIAIELEKGGYEGKEWGITEENIRITIKRLQKEIKRFNKENRLPTGN